MKGKRYWIVPLGSVIVLVMITLLTSCTPQGTVSTLAAPGEVLALAQAPGMDSDSQIVHTQWVFEELEGFSFNSRQPQFTRNTTDLWAEGVSPWRFRFTVMVEPGGLAYDSGWDGEYLWLYNVEADPLRAISRRPEADEIPSSPLDAMSFANPYPNLLKQAQQAPERLRDLGVEEIAPWGPVRTIGYEWDGVTAQTVRYAGYPHTIFFKITEGEHWLVEWSDVIHTDEGDVTSRRYQLTTWEFLEPGEAQAHLWTFVPPESVALVDALPVSESATVDSDKEPTLTIGNWSVPDYGYTPWVLGDLPAPGPTLVQAKAIHGQYILSYELGGNPVIVMAQGIGLSEKWGNEPEIIELSWATVEIGAIEPMGPPGWIALVRPHQTGDRPMPNVSLLAEIPDQELVLQIIESFVPMPE